MSNGDVIDIAVCRWLVAEISDLALSAGCSPEQGRIEEP